jgi:rhomboid family GlyGly-CTERM serine protease
LARREARFVKRLATGAPAWVGVAALLGICALAGWPVPHDAIDWQPARALAEPWRAVTAVGVHYNGFHLAANLAGLVLVGALGVVAQVPARFAIAWLAAWPLTQTGLAVRPDLAHYGGLSGVLHAGVAIVAVCLIWRGTRAQRVIGVAVLAGLVAKLLLEAPWGASLRHAAGWGIAIAPIAHTTGALAGGLCALVALRWPHRAVAPRRV